MPRIRRTDLIEQAFFEARIEHDQMPDEEMKERMNAFEQQWGGFEIDAFRHALQEGDEADRLVALFALNRFADEETKELLVPFLHSPIRKERWASAMVLGDQRDERAFAMLGALLTEHMEYVPPASEQEVRERVWRAIEQAREHYGTPSAWQQFLEPDMVQKKNELEAYQAEYTWHLIHRITMTNILGAWGNPQAIPFLRQAFQQCWQLEQMPPTQGGVSGGLLSTWYWLEDELAYALGQLEAWDALDELRLPPQRLKLARLYLVFGSLHLTITTLASWHIIRLLRAGTLDSERVVSVLQQRFGLDVYLARASLQHFEQWYNKRKITGLVGENVQDVREILGLNS
jgi:hypothetical protein